MVDEMKKQHPNGVLIAQNMNSTFASRRKELIEREPAVKDSVERWPALFTESQVRNYFSLLVLGSYYSSQHLKWIRTVNKLF